MDTPVCGSNNGSCQQSVHESGVLRAWNLLSHCFGQETFGEFPESIHSVERRQGHKRRDMSSFLKSCGRESPIQLSVRGPGLDGAPLRLLHQPYALIGRDHRADVSLDHKLVSRRHVYIQFVEGQAFWLDLDSRSGTSAQGELRKFGWLEAGRSIRIGPFEIGRPAEKSSRAEGDEGRSAVLISPLVARSYADQPLPEVALEFLNGPSRSECWPMNRVMSLLGSASGCKFRLADSSVSPFHCSLLRTVRGLWVVDLLGPDPISVNDTSVRHALLAPDDVLRIGRYRVRVKIQFARSDGSRSATPEDRLRRTADEAPQHAGILPLTSLVESTPFPLPVHRPPYAGLETGSRIELSGRTAGPEVLLATLGTQNLLEKSEVTELLLVPLLSQFGQMQQQMLDQFQQAITMIVQTFGTLHRDQMTTIREELDQLRELTREFQGIKQELATRTALSTSETPVDSARVEDTLVSAPGVPEQPAADPGVQSPEVASTQPADTVQSAGLRHRHKPQHASPELTVVRPEPKQPHRPSGESAHESERDVVLWLHERMMTLQRERESRWKKILKLLPGAS